MSDLEKQQRIEQATDLHVYFDDEDALADAEGEAQREHRRPLTEAEAEAEAFWAGHRPAARHSARIAA